MVLSSELFLFIFLPIALAIYMIVYKIKKSKQNLVLCILSGIFCAWSGIHTFLVLFLLTIMNFFAGKNIEAIVTHKRKKRVFLLAIIINILILVVYKYTAFFVSNLDWLANTIKMPWLHFDVPKILAPMGLSYYTFSAISYLVDIYKGDTEACPEFGGVYLYLLMFPKVISGPIMRFGEMKKALSNRIISESSFYNGVTKFMLGMSKKILLADRMSVLADAAFNCEWPLFFGYAWLGVICYALQLYFDFSGYTDMALGLGLMFGFKLRENFNYPYIAMSIKEFWRRWHITLSEWFRDYIYIPLGGNRKGSIIKYRNLLIVFFLTGLWHGAGWKFVLWGGVHGIFLLLESLFLDRLMKRVPSFIRHCYCIIVVLIGWVFFRANGLREAIMYLKRMFYFKVEGVVNIEILPHLTFEFFFFFILSVFLCTPMLTYVLDKVEEYTVWKGGLKDIFVLLTFIISICFLMGDSFNPFIYMKF